MFLPLINYLCITNCICLVTEVLSKKEMSPRVSISLVTVSILSQRKANNCFPISKQKPNLSLYSPYYAEACNEFAVPILAHRAKGIATACVDVELTVANFLECCVRFGRTGIWTVDSRTRGTYVNCSDLVMFCNLRSRVEFYLFNLLSCLGYKIWAKWHLRYWFNNYFVGHK